MSVYICWNEDATEFVNHTYYGDEVYGVLQDASVTRRIVVSKLTTKDGVNKAVGLLPTVQKHHQDAYIKITSDVGWNFDL